MNELGAITLTIIATILGVAVGTFSIYIYFKLDKKRELLMKEIEENNQSPQKCNLAGESIEKVATSKNSPPEDTNNSTKQGSILLSQKERDMYDYACKELSSTKQELNKEILEDYDIISLARKECRKSVYPEQEGVKDAK